MANVKHIANYDPGDTTTANGKKNTVAVNADLILEELVIGAALWFPDAAPRAIAAGLTPNAFSVYRHNTTWEAIADLVEAGTPVDPMLVAAQIDTNGATSRGLTIQELFALNSQATNRNIENHVHVILEHAATRRAAAELADAHYAVTNGAQPSAVIARLVERLDAAPTPEAHPFVDATDFVTDESPPYEWAVEGLLERSDRCIVTGEEGKGKSTLLRQIAVQLAAGIHPFTGESIARLRVLLVDTENSQNQTRRHLMPLIATAGNQFQRGQLHLWILGQSIDLANPVTAAPLKAFVAKWAPDVIIAGPLYKLGEGDPKDEQAARAIADTLDRLRALHRSALLLEAHQPYSDGSKNAKRAIRPYGASLWSRWPEYGIQLAPDGTLTHWRGQREERAWPTKLERSTPWPWATDQTANTVEPYEGPTHCMDAVVTFLNGTDAEFNLTQLGKRLRERGLSYRDQTISAAAKLAADKDLITRGTGARGALIFSRIPIDLTQGEVF